VDEVTLAKAEAKASEKGYLKLSPYIRSLIVKDLEDGIDHKE